MQKTSGAYHVVNYMEELVNQTLKGLLTSMPKDHRPSTRDAADIKALALNRLWPMYMTTEEGKTFIERDVVNDRIDRDVQRELQAAIDLVSKHPRK